MTSANELPVAVIGAGPAGLAAAAHLIERGMAVKLYEAAAEAAANVRAWGHVRLFSPWRYNVDKAAARLLQRTGWPEPPADDLPTGRALFEQYLRPLAETDAIRAVLETGASVRAMSRVGLDKVVSKGREGRPFVLVVETPTGSRIDLARAVLDATGTWHHHNHLGASGIPALGEDEHKDRITYGIPDVRGEAGAMFASQRVLVVGGGHSAANVLLDLASLAESDDRLRITWAVRAKNPDRAFGGGEADQLAARGRLGSDLRRLVETARLTLVTGFAAERVDEARDGITVMGSDQDGSRHLGRFDRIIVATGQRPELDMTRELRLDLDPWLECPRALGPMIDPNLHSCGTVRPHGFKELSHPEPGFFTVGIKSYGRAPTFLMATGYEQVRSIAAHLAGDHDAASEVQLVLPETGVCSVGLAPGDKDDACCGAAPAIEVEYASAAACCALDAAAKARGEPGCGCGENVVAGRSIEEKKVACCGAARV